MSPSLNSQVIPLNQVPSPKTATPEHRRPVILVVDDERVIADTLALILSRSGFTTFTAYNGQRALEVASLVSPELLISDVVMPGMTGVTLAIAMVQLIPACKVLLFSGQGATADLLSEARASGHDFSALSKPIHPSDMLRRISESLDIPHAGFGLTSVPVSAGHAVAQGA